MAAIWSLLARGLVYIDISQPAPENWKLELTDVGRKALKDEEVNPDDPSGYLSRLYEDIPQISEVVRPYLKEALNTYYHESYLASSVMLGVAAEAIFLELAESFVSWKGRSAGKLGNVLSNPKTVYLQKFVEFRKRLDTEKINLPSQLADGLDLYMSSVLDLLRTSRNEAGHPTGQAIQRDDCLTGLRIFARLAKGYTNSSTGLITTSYSKAQRVTPADGAGCP